MTVDQMRYRALPSPLGARIWDVRDERWHSAAHPNVAWMEELAVMLSIQSQVRDEIKANRLLDAAREAAWTEAREQKRREGKVA